MGWKLALCGEGGALCSLRESVAKVRVVTCRRSNTHLIRGVSKNKNLTERLRMPVGSESNAGGYITQMFMVEDLSLQDAATSGVFWIFFLVCGKSSVSFHIHSKSIPFAAFSVFSTYCLILTVS